MHALRSVLSVLAAGPALAWAGATLGPTYPIAELDTLDEIRQQAARHDPREWLRRTPTDYAAFQSVAVPVAKVDRSRLFDPTYTLPNDITDETGKVLAAKGTKVNVYDRLKMRGRMIVIDGSDAQFNWLQQVAQPTDDDKVLLAGGNVLTARRARQMNLYLLDARFVERFGIQAVPTIVQQEGRLLRVTEYAVAP